MTSSSTAARGQTLHVFYVKSGYHNACRSGSYSVQQQLHSVSAAQERLMLQSGAGVAAHGRGEALAACRARSRRIWERPTTNIL